MRVLERPTISVIVPSVNPSRPLKRTIDSALAQFQDGDEVVVVADTTDHAQPEIRATVESYGSPAVRFLECAGAQHTFGHEQIDYGVSLARGQWISFQDDDDLYTPDALAAIRYRIGLLKQPGPLLFRFVSSLGLVLWDGRWIKQGWIGGHSLVCPNIPGLVAPRGRCYEGDFVQVRDTMALWAERGVRPVWCEDIIVVQRPEANPLGRAFLNPSRGRAAQPQAIPLGR